MADRQLQRNAGIGNPVVLGRAARRGSLGPLHGHLQVAAGGQLVEVVAGHVGMEVEGGRCLGRCDPIVGLSDVQVDITAGRVAEGASNRGDRR